MADNTREVLMQVYGRVQGVGFRNAAEKQAKSLGLTIQAENVADGSVEIRASGDREKVDKFVQWTNQGPLLADVDRVDVQDIGEGRTSRGFA